MQQMLRAAMPPALAANPDAIKQMLSNPMVKQQIARMMAQRVRKFVGCDMHLLAYLHNRGVAALYDLQSCVVNHFMCRVWRCPHT
jgi:hypothetical protein